MPKLRFLKPKPAQAYILGSSTADTRLPQPLNALDLFKSFSDPAKPNHNVEVNCIANCLMLIQAVDHGYITPGEALAKMQPDLEAGLLYLKRLYNLDNVMWHDVRSEYENLKK